MITEQEIPATWTEALRSIQVLRPEAVIGGGCLRDLDNGRPVKDIDIFVRGSKAEHLESLHQALSDGDQFHVEEIDSDNWYPVGDGNDVVGFFEMRLYVDDPPIQIIMVDFDCSLIVERFDYGICRIAFDGVTLIKSPEYLLDQANEVFKLRRSRDENQLAASVHRYARLVQKYPGWTFAPYLSDAFEDALA
jgi:hypothetical protein